MSLSTAVVYVNALLEAFFAENSPLTKFLLQTIVTWLSLVRWKVWSFKGNLWEQQRCRTIVL